MKLQFSTHTPPRTGWIETMEREREHLAELLLDSPSLRREVPGLLARRANAAIQRAVRALASHGDTVGAAAARVAADYQPDEVLGNWVPDSPPI